MQLEVKQAEYAWIEQKKYWAKILFLEKQLFQKPGEFEPIYLT